MGAVTERNIEGKAYRQTQVSFLFSTFASSDKVMWYRKTPDNRATL